MEAMIRVNQSELICDDIMLLVTTCKQHLNQIAKDNGLTSIQLFALRAISEGNNATGKIAQILHCDASNVTGIIDRLTLLNLVTRKEDPSDRRVKTLQLTKEGEAVMQDALQSLPNKLGCDRLSLQEAKLLHSTITKLTS
jgi:DNA-binding MarR family transcriptional regulator